MTPMRISIGGTLPGSTRSTGPGSCDLELRAVDALRRELLVELRRDRTERDRRRIVGMCDDDRPTGVGAGAQLGHERHLSEQRNVEIVGERAAATVTEQRIP